MKSDATSRTRQQRPTTVTMDINMSLLPVHNDQTPPMSKTIQFNTQINVSKSRMTSILSSAKKEHEEFSGASNSVRMVDRCQGIVDAGDGSGMGDKASTNKVPISIDIVPSSAHSRVSK